MRKIKLTRKHVIFSVILLLMFITFLSIAPRLIKPLAGVIKKQSLIMWKGFVCRQDGYLFGADEAFCRNNCRPKDPAARWCDSSTYNVNVASDGMITYVAQGGCAIAAMNCHSVNCPQDAWTCMAECPPDPRRVLTKDGCDCTGNWSPYQDKCVCASPYVLRKGECVAVKDKQCVYDQEQALFYIMCLGTEKIVEIYWDSQLIYGCEGSCFSSICVAKQNIPIGNYWYSRGDFKEKLKLPKGRIEAAFSNIGGIYEACRVRM